MIYKASEVDALLIELRMQLNGVCARTETHRKGLEHLAGHVLPPDTLSVIQDVLHKLYQLEEKV
jgi:hypothetical protein